MSKPTKPVKAWAVVQADEDNRLAPYGNGLEWQFPVFLTRDECRAWRVRTSGHMDERVVPVVILAREDYKKLTEGEK